MKAELNSDEKKLDTQLFMRYDSAHVTTSHDSVNAVGEYRGSIREPVNMMCHT